VLELAEEALDQIALAVDAPVDGAVNQPTAFRRDVSCGAAGSDQLKQGVGVIAAVGDDVTAFEASEQERCRAQVVVLSGGQHEAHRQAILIDQGVDLGTQSSTRAADGVILAPFFPPAACWWARMIELSMNAIECGDLAAKVSKICTQTPALAQRLKRL
jgi:hypothetical protein